VSPMMSHVSSKTSLMAQVLGSSLGQYLAAGSVPFSLAEESFGFLGEQDLLVFEYEAHGRLYSQRPNFSGGFLLLEKDNGLGEVASRLLESFGCFLGRHSSL